MAQRLQQRMYTMLTNNTLTDVTFIVQGEEIKGHKAVIASYGGLLKEYVEKNNQIIDVGDIISPETFKAVLQYIYTDEIAITKSNVLEILHAASEFSLKSLEQMCVKHLAKRLSCGNLEEMSKQASFFNSQELLNVCTQYFGNNTQRIIESKEFLAFSEEVLNTLCSSHQIDCLDVELFSSCVKWAENRCKSLNRQCTPENLRIALGDTLQKIRFSSMSMEEFVQTVVKTNILTTIEVGQVIIDIQGKDNVSQTPLYKGVSREAGTMANEAPVAKTQADGAANEAQITMEEAGPLANEAQVTMETDTTSDAPAAKRFKFSQCNHCALQQETGILSYRARASRGAAPVALLVTQRPIRPYYSNFIEIEIVDEDVEGNLSVGLVPPGYASDKQPGWKQDSVGYIAEGFIHFQSRKEGDVLSTCTLGDRMGVGVKFPKSAPPIFYFTKNGTVVYQRIWDALKNGSHHMAIGMRSLNEKAKLLDSDMWLLDDIEERIEPAEETYSKKFHNINQHGYFSLQESTGILRSSGSTDGFIGTHNAFGPDFSNYIELEFVGIDSPIWHMAVGVSTSSATSLKVIRCREQAAYYYESGNINVQSHHKPLKGGQSCISGDRIGCGVNFQTGDAPELFFTKNGKVVYRQFWENLERDNYRLAVGISSTKVILVDSDMWHSFN